MDLETALREQLRELDSEYRSRAKPILDKLVELRLLSPLSPEILNPHPGAGISKGRILHTRDGSKIGNAIVKGVAACQSGTLRDHLLNTEQLLWNIETDFGNTAKLSTHEIMDDFTLGPIQHNYDRWFFDRLDAISKAQSDG